MCSKKIDKFQIFCSRPILGVQFLAVISLLLVLNMRPAILGQKLGVIYVGIIVITFSCVLIWKKRLKISTHKISLLFIYFLIVGYVVFQILVVGVNDIYDAFATLVFIMIGFLSIVLFDFVRLKLFSKTLIWICVLFGVSYLITYSIFVFQNFVPVVSNINLSTHTTNVYDLEVLFPFSPVYNGMANVMGHRVPRAIGMMREPGLYQLILIISYWLQDLYRFRYNVLIKTILIFSLVVTFSTAGYALLLGTLFLKIYQKTKQESFKYLILGSPFIAVLFYYLIFSSSQFGLIEKFDNQSGITRLQAVVTSLELIYEYPFLGIGFHDFPPNVQIGINFLGTIAQLGIIGTLIFLMPFFYVWSHIKNCSIQFINIFLSVILTMLTAQPIYDKPVVFLFLSLLLAGLHRQQINKKYKLFSVNYSNAS